MINTMADFSVILDDSPYTALQGCIDSFLERGLQAELAEFCRQKPSMALSPLLHYCVQKDRLAPFEEL